MHKLELGGRTRHQSRLSLVGSRLCNNLQANNLFQKGSYIYIWLVEYFHIRQPVVHISDVITFSSVKVPIPRIIHTIVQKKCYRAKHNTPLHVHPPELVTRAATFKRLPNISTYRVHLGNINELIFSQNKQMFESTT